MTSRSIVLHDACVLYPNYLRDLLIQLATIDVFRARWTEQIHDEWIRNLLNNRPNVNAAQLQRLKTLINASVPDSLVTDFEHLILSLQLPDPDDRHVLAAAIVTQAERIITMNLRDFPHDVLAPYGIVAQHPDDFIADLLDRYPRQVLSSIDTLLNRFKNPPISFDEYLNILLKQGLPNTVAMLRSDRSL